MVTRVSIFQILEGLSVWSYTLALVVVSHDVDQKCSICVGLFSELTSLWMFGSVLSMLGFQ
jgi:hypothetical protein